MSINISKIKKDLISIRSNYKKSQYKTLTLNKSKQDKKYIVPTFNHYKAKYLIINNPEKNSKKHLMNIQKEFIHMPINTLVTIMI